MSALEIYSSRRFDGDDDDFLYGGEDAKATAHTLRDMRGSAEVDKHPAGIAVGIETPKGKLYELVIAEDQLIAALADIAAFREQDLLRDQVLAAMTTHYCDEDC